MPRFTKKDYVNIANIISNTKLEAEGLTQAKAFEILEQKLRNLFAEDNPQFDRMRFLEACVKRKA